MVLLGIISSIFSTIFSFLLNPVWGIIYLVVYGGTLFFLWTGDKNVVMKVFWTIAIIFFPFIGLLLYFFLG